jgi:hypothetical protein
VRWLIGTGSAGTIERAFRERGLVLGDEYPAMIAPIADLPEPDLGGVTVETVETDRAAPRVGRRLRDAFGFHGDVAEQVSAVPRVAEPARTRSRVHAPARKGEAVATAILHTPAVWPGIYGSRSGAAAAVKGFATLATGDRPRRRRARRHHGDAAGHHGRLPGVREARLSHHLRVPLVADPMI